MVCQEHSIHPLVAEWEFKAMVLAAFQGWVQWSGDRVKSIAVA